MMGYDMPHGKVRTENCSFLTFKENNLSEILFSALD